MAELPQEARDLVARGYRKVSNKYCLIARIDQPDWLLYMAQQMNRAPAMFFKPTGKTPSGSWCDHYRRCYSKDQQTIPLDWVHAFPSSSNDDVGYIGDEPEVFADTDQPTPGEWFMVYQKPHSLGGDTDNGGWEISAPGCEQLAYVWKLNWRWAPDEWCRTAFGTREAEANARLIVAAKGLLSAAVSYIEAVENGADLFELEYQFRAAVKKARGTDQVQS